jgi:hypothetical protein
VRIIGSSIKTILVLTALVWLSGCVQTKSVPGYARAGDIVVLGLGGIHRNTISTPVLATSDLNITITDSALNTYTLKASKVFKSYPNYSSSLTYSTFNGELDGLALMPFDGGWFVTVPLAQATDRTVPLPLAVGPATISITSVTPGDLVNTKLLSEGDLDAIPIEIIAGTSTFDYAYNNQFDMYTQSTKTFDVAPVGLGSTATVGGAYFVINYTDDSLFLDGIEPMVLPSNHNPYVQLSYNVRPNGDGTGTILVTLLNPAGFTTPAVATKNSSMLADLTVKLQYFSSSDATVIKSAFSLDLASSYYIDMSGAVIPALSPQLTHFVDL